MTRDPSKYLDAVFGIARDAGRRILDVYARDFGVEQKQDGSPVTAADAAAHAVIAAALGALTPDIPVLSEEAAAIDADRRRAWARFWLVDPLDGTKEFISRNGQFTVNIALIERERPVLGVVHAPVTGVTYLACVGGGAHKCEGEQSPRPIRVRATAARPVIVASRLHAGRALAGFLERVGDHQLVSMGSSLKFCLVAEGAADVYPRLGPTMEWDTGAAQCVVEQAGGRVVDVANRPLRYNKPSLKNPWLITAGAGAENWASYLPFTEDES